MKEIKAFIRLDKLPKVIETLHKMEGINGVHIFETSRRLGWKKYEQLQERSGEDSVEEMSFVKIEVFCENRIVSDTVFEIEKAIRTKERGDGEIYISDIEEADFIKNGSYMAD